MVSWSDDTDEFLPRIWGSAGVRIRSKGKGFGKAGKGKTGKGKARKGRQA